MSTQQVTLDINQIKPEALNIFYAHILRQCELAKHDPEIYQEYLNSKKGGKENAKSRCY